MRIGLVNPYSLDVPGGVQMHVMELAAYLISVGHEVSVLTPAEPDTELPPYAVSAGRAMPVRYNGSVARLAFGPAVAARAKSWVQDGSFDVVHIHEPACPSVSLLALWAASGPLVATFHSSQIKSRSLRIAAPMLQPGLDKISGRIAVSERARATVASELGGECAVIPNGVDVTRFAARQPRQPGGYPDSSDPTLLFLGRVAEPRKGLAVLLRAMPTILAAYPQARLLIAGPGECADLLRQLPAQTKQLCEVLGPVSETRKVELLATADVYVAPNTGGESFGIILVEALAAGAPVLASDLAAFAEVLQHGESGVLFESGNPVALADAALRLLASPTRRAELSRLGPLRAQGFDWSRVGPQVLAVYDSVRPTGSVVGRHRSSLRGPRRRPPSNR